MFKKTGQKPKQVNNIYLGLALTGNMITPEEHRDIVESKITIVRRNMIDENSHGLVLQIPAPAGHTLIALYHNRCDDILIARLLGED